MFRFWLVDWIVFQIFLFHFLHLYFSVQFFQEMFKPFGSDFSFWTLSRGFCWRYISCSDLFIHFWFFKIEFCLDLRSSFPSKFLDFIPGVHAFPDQSIAIFCYFSLSWRRFESLWDIAGIFVMPFSIRITHTWWSLGWKAIAKEYPVFTCNFFVAFTNEHWEYVSMLKILFPDALATVLSLDIWVGTF